MEQIRIMSLEGLVSAEKPEMVPYYVLLFLKEGEKTKGIYYRLERKDQSEDIPSYGQSYYNELSVIKLANSERRRCGDPEEEATDKVVFSTGMLRWRAGHRDSLDSPDNNIMIPSILKEKKDELIFGYKTGLAVKIFRYSHESGECQLIEKFNIEGHLRSLERIMLAREAITDEWKFGEYVKANLGRKWWTEQDRWSSCWHKFGDDIGVLLAVFYKADSDPAADAYRLFVWKKGKGIGFSEIYETGLYNSKRDFILDIGFEATLEGCELTIVAKNERHGFRQVTTFEIIE